MKCSRDLWTAALGLLKRATLAPDKSHSAQMARLSEIVVSASNRRLRLAGMDMMVEMVVDIPADGDLEPCVVPLVTLTKLTKAGKRSKGEDMAVDNIDTGLRLCIAGREFEIARGDDDRPAGWQGADWSTGSVQSHGTPELKAALDYCSLAAGHDPTRPQLAGVYIGDEHMVATDGHRLHVTRNIDSFPGGPVILSNDTIGALQAAIKAADPPWVMARHKPGDPGLVQFHVDGVLLDVLITARCVDAEFPPWRSICPDHADDSFAVDADRWMQSLQTASKLADVGGAWIAVHKDCRVSIEGLFSEVIPLECKPDRDLEAHFAPRYLLDASAGAGERITVEYASHDKGEYPPYLIRASDDHYAVVMPMRGE